MDDDEARTVEVTGICATTLKETLDDYFSSARRGGDVAKIDYIRGSGKALITFVDAQGARKALETGPHSLDRCNLTVSKKKAEIYENDKIYVEGIPSETTREHLELYMERMNKDSEVKNIKYGIQRGDTRNAIIEFENDIDFDKIQEGYAKRPTIGGQRISIKRVPLCKKILVQNLPTSATRDSVMYRFESKKARGGDVEDVNLDLVKSIALVEFQDPSVIGNVLAAEQTLDNTKLSVERHFPILGDLADLLTEKDIPDAKVPKETATKPSHPSEKALEEEIDRDLYFYLKDTHPAKLNLALKDPQPNIEMKNESACFKFASKETKEHFLTFLKEYKYEIVPFDPALAKQGLKEEIKVIKGIFGLGQSVVFVEKYDEGYIKLVGRDVPNFDRAIAEVNECIEKAKQCEESIEILPLHLKFLQKSTRFRRMENSLKGEGFEVQFNVESGKITFKGSQTQMQRFTTNVQEIVGRFGERSLNQSKFSLLKSETGFAHVKTLLNNEQVLEVLVDGSGDLILYGMDQTQVDQAYTTIENAIGELKLPRSMETKSKKDLFLNEIGSSIPVALHTEGGESRIRCFRAHLQSLSEKLHKFLEGKKTVEMSVPLETVILRYLALHGEDLLEALRVSSPEVTIAPGTEAITVSGEKPLVENCCVSIKRFAGGLKFESMNYGTPETSASITGPTGKSMIENIERKHKCAIVTTKEETDRPSPFMTATTMPVHNLNLTEELKSTLQCRYTFPTGKIIEVHQGDILNHPIDYLVNAANDELKHAGGLARAIVEKGGWRIQEESSRALVAQGKIKLFPGDVVTTDGGNLLCKQILHAVVPKYSTKSGQGAHEEEARVGRYLSHACSNVLKKATGGRTIAIPVLGTGIYGVPHKVSAESLISSAETFFQENPSHSLQEIHFVDNDPGAVEALMTGMLSRFRMDCNFDVNEAVRDRWIPVSSGANTAPASSPVSTGGDAAFQTPEGMEIRLTIGNIAKSTTDVIVNTASNDLNLTRNPCSKAILSEAGSSITRLCEQWVKEHGQVQECSFAITNGAKLKCKNVFHVCCPSWASGSPDDGEKKLRQLVQKILAEAQKRSLTSISIPALGTGTLNFPQQLVAKILFEEAMAFSSKIGSTLKIKQINIVVYSGNTKAVKIFTEQFQSYSGKKLDAKISKTKRKTSSKLRGRFVFHTKEKSETSEDETRGVKVEIIRGNIVAESTDAIGFLVAEDITHGGQIGKALLQAAGAELEKEYRGLGKLKLGKVVMTGAGNLKACCLLHMVMKNSPGIFDTIMIREAVKKCIDLADSFGLSSLAIPAVGTGTLNKDAKQSAEILYGCIKEYRKRETKSLKLIRIVILNEKVFEDFNKAFSRKDPSTGASKTRKQVVLKIAAESSCDFATIKEELDAIEKEGSLMKTVETMQKLDERKLAEILQAQDTYDVRIETKPELGIVRIFGLAKNVANAFDEIQQKKLAWEQERHHIDATVREVQWFFYDIIDGGTVIPEKYADSISAQIERAYKKKEASVIVGEDTNLRIDFATMTETCLVSNEKMKVYRRPCQAFPWPQHWEYQPIISSTGTELAVHCVDITRREHHAEYEKVLDMFKVTLPSVKIVKIERIQNPHLYQMYEGKKITKSNGGNEMQLYHGTAKSAVKNINSTGFNRSYCGKNAVRFGNGVYFATKASYSALTKYAVPDQGLQYIYVAKVLVGKYTKGKEGLKDPPTVEGQTSRYDSVVDNVSNPEMFVIFYDYESYPEYLVTLKSA